MNRAEIRAALDEAFDHAVVFHGFAKHLRDYDFYVYLQAAPSTGVPPEHRRYRFTHCVVAEALTALPAEIWKTSLDPRLLDHETYLAAFDELDGYVWGVSLQSAYPGFTVVESSGDAKSWSDRVGIPFHEALYEGNGHRVRLVFSDLEVSVVAAGESAYTVGDD
ncbi:hypothetical protein [Antribacter gilvus]|uniref:YxiG-like protein n=1 Tax=Antribacter gilvus TaxID=2304675 RepID=UPI000F76C88F|nr:hypothetical protein [Antribacter gilvus]